MRVANNQVVVAEGEGTVDLQVLSTTGKSLTITLTDVYFCPQFTSNIFSTNFFAEKSENHAVRMSKNKHILIGDHHQIALHAEHKLLWLPTAKERASSTAGNFYSWYRPGFFTRSERLNDPCRGRRWGLVVTPHPVNKILSCLVLSDAAPGAAAVLASATAATVAAAVVPALDAVFNIMSPSILPMEYMTMRLFHERVGHINSKDCFALAAQQRIKLTETVVLEPCPGHPGPCPD